MLILIKHTHKQLGADNPYSTNQSNYALTTSGAQSQRPYGQPAFVLNTKAYLYVEKKRRLLWWAKRFAHQ